MPVGSFRRQALLQAFPCAPCKRASAAIVPAAVIVLKNGPVRISSVPLLPGAAVLPAPCFSHASRGSLHEPYASTLASRSVLAFAPLLLALTDCFSQHQFLPPHRFADIPHHGALRWGCSLLARAHRLHIHGKPLLGPHGPWALEWPQVASQMQLCSARRG